MKLNFIPSLISVSISMLIAYGLYSLNTNENKELFGVGCFIFSSVTLIFATGIKFEFPKTALNIKVLSGVFFSIGFISNLIFTFLNFSKSTYIVINGIILLLFILLAYSINKEKN